MPATSACSGAMMPPASPHSDQQCAEQAGRADDDDALAAARAAAPSASSYDPCISANSGCGSCASTGTISDRNRFILRRERRRRARAGAEQCRARFCRRDHSDLARPSATRMRTRAPAVRNEMSDPVEPLQPPREAVVDGFAEQQEADHVRARTPARRPAGTACPSTSAMPAAGSSVSIASRSGDSSSISSPVRSFSDDATSTVAELVGDPEQVDADALLLALRSRGQRRGLVGREIEMRSDRALQREVARQQDGVRLEPRAALRRAAPRRLRRSSAARDRACARLRATRRPA